MAAKHGFEALLQEALDLPDEKKIYFNGFIVSMSPTDAVIVLQNNNKPIAYLNTTHTIAKTLANQLNGIIKNFEKDTKRKIPTLDQIVKAVSDNANTE